MYILARVDKLTESYHPQGGVAVICSSLERAKELLPQVREGEWLDAHEYALEDSVEEKVYIFPDSGCC